MARGEHAADDRADCARAVTLVFDASAGWLEDDPLATLVFILVGHGRRCAGPSDGRFVIQNKSGAGVVPTGVHAAQADATKIAEVLAFEKDMEAAVVRGDVEALEPMLSPDFILFTHSNSWTSGGDRSPVPFHLLVQFVSGLVPAVAVREDKVSDSMGSSLTSPRTTAASMSFSNTSTSAIFAASAALGAGTPVGTTLGAGLVFSDDDWRRWPLRSQQP